MVKKKTLPRMTRPFGHAETAVRARYNPGTGPTGRTPGWTARQ